MNPYQIIIVLCGLAVLSYVYDLAASWSRIPSVLLLMGTGIALRQFTPDLARRRRVTGNGGGFTRRGHGTTMSGRWPAGNEHPRTGVGYGRAAGTTDHLS